MPNAELVLMSTTCNFETETGTRLTLHHQDCVAGMREHLADGSVSVVVTSPPYNLGIDYNGYDDSIPRRDYLTWMRGWGAVVYRVLADDGSLFLNVGSKPTDPTVPFRILAEMVRAHLKPQNVIHWVKSIAIKKTEVGDYDGIRKDVVVGHYKPINSARFLNDCHEYIFHLTKSCNVGLDRLAVGVAYQDKSNVNRWKGNSSDVHCRGNTWFIPYETIRSKEKDRPHPATFPIELPRRCVKLHGLRRSELVVDPFLGIGTTALACAELDMSFVGYEIDPLYFGEACERLAAVCQQVKGG